MDDQKQALLEQASRAQKMWAAVVLAVIDDAIAENRKTGRGGASIISWASSRDGREVLSNAGIEPTMRAAQGLAAYVEKGVKTSTGLTLKNSEL